MLDLKIIRAELEDVANKLRKKKFDLVSKNATNHPVRG